jgi:hypothetical protein
MMERIVKRTALDRRRRARKIIKRLWERRSELDGEGVRVYHDPLTVRLAILWDTVNSSGSWTNAVAVVQTQLTTLGYTVRNWSNPPFDARLFAITTTGNPNDIPTNQFPILP